MLFCTHLAINFHSCALEENLRPWTGDLDHLDISLKMFTIG